MNQPEALTEAQALACFKIVRAWIHDKVGPSWQPVLYGVGFHCNGWAIALEGALDDWPWHLSQDESVTWPDGVFAEPGASWYLGLYPA